MCITRHVDGENITQYSWEDETLVPELFYECRTVGDILITAKRTPKQVISTFEYLEVVQYHNVSMWIVYL